MQGATSGTEISRLPGEKEATLVSRKRSGGNTGDQTEGGVRELKKEGVASAEAPGAQEGSPDEEAVMQQAELLGAIETEMTKHRLRTLLRIHALLTPEQRKEMMAIRRERHGGPEMLFEDCGGDLEKLCPDAESPFDYMGCLHEHEDHVSEGCASALDTHRHKRGFRRGPLWH